MIIKYLDCVTQNKFLYALIYVIQLYMIYYTIIY